MAETSKPLDSAAAKAKANAVFNHDAVNIVAMSIVVCMCLQFLIENIVIANIGTRKSITPTGYDSFQNIFNYFCFYMLFDSIWIIIQPSCVASKSPLVILIHHLVTVGMISVVIVDSHYTFYMAVILLCESNTVFLALRRNSKRGTWLNYISGYLFLATWILFRLILFPCIMVLSFYEWHYRAERFGTYWNIVVPGQILFAGLIIMSLQWTYEMFTKKLLEKEAGKE